MILLLGGYSCTGKTLLANRIMEELNINYFSMDYLKMGIFRSDESCGFTPMDSDEHIANKIWPIVEEMIYTLIENGQDMVIEGCYIMPELVNKMDLDYMDEVETRFIGFSEDYLEKNFDSQVIKYKGAIEDRTAEDERPVEQFIENHIGLKKRSEAHGLKFIQINENYKEEMDQVYLDIRNIFKR